MSLPQEWLLALLLLALYLWDAFTLTEADGAFLVRSPFGWGARFPTARFTLAGRHLFLAPLLPPATPVFTLRWAKHRTAAAVWGAEVAAANLAPVAVASAFSFWAVLVMTPLALATRQAAVWVLLAIAIAYLSVLGAIAALWACRARLQLPRAACAKLTAEMMFCPPLAANLVRRISQSMPVAESFIPVARRLLAQPRWEQACEDLRRRIEAQLECTEQGSPEQRTLLDLRAQLA